MQTWIGVIKAMFRNNGPAIFFAQGSLALCCTLLYGVPNVPSQDQGAAESLNHPQPNHWSVLMVQPPRGSGVVFCFFLWNQPEMMGVSPRAGETILTKYHWIMVTSFFSKIVSGCHHFSWRKTSVLQPGSVGHLAIWFKSDSNLMLSGISSSFRMAFLKANLQWESHGLPPKTPQKNPTEWDWILRNWGNSTSHPNDSTSG